MQLLLNQLQLIRLSRLQNKKVRSKQLLKKRHNQQLNNHNKLYKQSKRNKFNKENNHNKVQVNQLHNRGLNLFPLLSRPKHQ